MICPMLYAMAMGQIMMMIIMMMMMMMMISNDCVHILLLRECSVGRKLL